MGEAIVDGSDVLRSNIERLENRLAFANELGGLQQAVSELRAKLKFQLVYMSTLVVGILLLGSIFFGALDKYEIPKAIREWAATETGRQVEGRLKEQLDKLQNQNATQSILIAELKSRVDEAKNGKMFLSELNVNRINLGDTGFPNYTHITSAGMDVVLNGKTRASIGTDGTGRGYLGVYRDGDHRWIKYVGLVDPGAGDTQ